jgi:hypothetical protein
MKHLLRNLLLVLLALAPSAFTRIAPAQTVVNRPAIAFVTSERNAIYVRTPDGKIDSIFHNIPNILTATKIAVLGSDPTGSNFLIAGNFTYFDIGSSQFVTYTGLIAFPKNFDPTHGTTQIKFLKRATVVSTSAFRPVGALNAEGTEWYATMLSSTSGSIPLYFYHGRMDKNETDPGYSIDSAGPSGEKQLEGGYHLSNMSITPDGKMVCTSVDRLNQDNQTRFTFYVWRIHDVNAPLTAIDYSGKVKGFNLRVNPDSNFAFAVFGKSNTRAELALANLNSPPDNSIQFFNTPIDGNNIDFTTASNQLPRSAIPSDMNFFSGFRGSLPSGAQYEEVDPFAAQYGAAGDINFSSTGDTVVFVTHEAPDNISNRFTKSAIYSYDFTTGSSELVYNDPTKLELQPVFITMPFTIPQPEGTLAVSVNSLSFGTVDTGKTASKNAVLTNGAALGAKTIVVDSIRIIGQSQSEFTWSGATLPSTLAVGDAGLTLNFTFTPKAPAVQKNASARIYWNGSATPTTISLTGTAKIPPPVSVGRDDAHLSITVSPNPFSSKLLVDIAPAESGHLELHFFDQLGHDLYQTESNVARGQHEGIAIDAQALSLSAGSYYVSLTLNGLTTVRQVILK